VLEGWVQDGEIDLFVWFEGHDLVHAQITAGEDLVEWKAPGHLRSGRVRVPEPTGRLHNPGSGLIDFDRRLKQERVEMVRDSIEKSSLPEMARHLALALLFGRLPTEPCEEMRRMIRAAMDSNRRS